MPKGNSRQHHFASSHRSMYLWGSSFWCPVYSVSFHFLIRLSMATVKLNISWALAHSCSSFTVFMGSCLLVLSWSARFLAYTNTYKLRINTWCVFNFSAATLLSYPIVEVKMLMKFLWKGNMIRIFRWLNIAGNIMGAKNVLLGDDLLIVCT